MAYKKIDQEDIKFLEKVVGSENLKTRDQIEEDFAHDELKAVFSYPEIHIFVTDKFQIIQIMKYANDNLIPVTVRGSGTGLVGACVAIHDFIRYNKNE